MLLDPLGSGAQHLELIRLRFGEDMAFWPHRLVTALEFSLLLAFATLWRKICRYFECDPWRLAPAFDPTLSRQERQVVVREFLDAPECCLDPGLCLPLRQYSADLDDYLEPADAAGPVSDPGAEREDDPTLRLFLRTLFEQSVVTSTQVELQFAGLTMWTSGSMSGPRLNLPGLSAKATGKSFADAVSRWRALPWIETGPTRADGRSRPAWTKSANPGHKTTYLHLFAKQVRRDLAAAEDLSCAMWPA